MWGFQMHHSGFHSHIDQAISWECSLLMALIPNHDTTRLIILSDMEHLIVGLDLQIRLGSV